MRPGVLASTSIGLLAVAGWAASCGAPQEVQLSSVSGQKSESAAPADGTKEGAAAVPREPLDLRKFTPVLALSELREAREALDEGRSEDAAHQVLAWARAETDAVTRARAEFVAGRLFSQVGEKTQARQAFLEAARPAWGLRADAWLRAAELFFEEGQIDEARAALKQAGELNRERRRLLLDARLSAKQGQTKEAEALYRELLREGASLEVRLELVRFELSLVQGFTDLEVKKREASRALGDLTPLFIGLPKEHAWVIEGRKLERELRIWSGAPGEVETSRAEQIAHLSGLLDRGAYAEAIEFAAPITFGSKDFSEERCHYDFLVGKALSLQRKWGEAADQIAASVDRCQVDPALHARLLFTAGKYSAADGRDARAVKYYAELERLYPENSLADDARLRAARSYKDMGAPARFIDLLNRLPEDYPDGDMTMEGVLELALYRIERKDWAGAALILQRGASVVRSRDAARGQEFSGCERYFLARALGELGKKEEELAEYESIVRELPLSYYMLHAYSRLREADKGRAEASLAEGVELASTRPFSFPHRKEFESAEFLRGMELLRVSDLTEGKAVLGRLRLGEEADQSLLWGIALLYDQAGDAQVSHAIARGKLTDWLSHYPTGDWERPWQIGFPRPYHSIVQKESRTTGVPEWFIYGIMREESTFDPAAESPAAAYGLMQLIVPTARGIGQKAGLPWSPQALKKPHVNIALGSRVLSSLARQFPDNPWLAIPGYNAGPGRPKRWLRERPDMDFDVWVEMIPFRETRRYTKRVLSSRAAYAFLYDRERADEALILPRRLKLP